MSTSYHVGVCSIQFLYNVGKTYRSNSSQAGQLVDWLTGEASKQFGKPGGQINLLIGPKGGGFGVASSQQWF